MPIEHRVGSLLDQPDVQVILHQANIFCTLAKRTSSGFARLVEQVCPDACDADGRTVEGDLNKIGTYSTGQDDKGRIFVNCYSQTGMGAKARNTDYDAILSIFLAVEKKCRTHKRVVGIPYKYGCGLAGGNWKKVYTIIKGVFADSPIKCVVVRLPTEAEIPLD